jgi:hypothetical protein
MPRVLRPLQLRSIDLHSAPDHISGCCTSEQPSRVRNRQPGNVGESPQAAMQPKEHLDERVLQVWARCVNGLLRLRCKCGQGVGEGEASAGDGAVLWWCNSVRALKPGSHAADASVWYCAAANSQSQNTIHITGTQPSSKKSHNFNQPRTSLLYQVHTFHVPPPPAAPHTTPPSPRLSVACPPASPPDGDIAIEHAIR